MNINFIWSTLQVRWCLQRVFMQNTLCPSTLSRWLV